MMNQVVDKERAATFAEEAFVVDVQSFLHHMMEEKGISRADLAKAMGVSKARVSQIFSDEAKNFTVRLLARAAHAMGEVVELDAEFLRECRARDRQQAADMQRVDTKSNVFPIWSKVNDFEEGGFFDCCSNDELDAFVELTMDLAKAA